MRKTAAIAELKANLSRYLSRVKSGEEILVTERGVAIARLVPVARQDMDDLRELERQGLVRIGTGRLPKDFWKLPRPRDPGAAVRKGLQQERDEGW
jgi:prevent-host-death family protein